MKQINISMKGILLWNDMIL